MSHQAIPTQGPTHEADGPAHEDHGSTPAAWTAVAIITIAFVVGTLGIMMANWVMFWVAVGLVILGAVAGKVMGMMGLGKKRDVPA